ncbi:MAG: ABC transporter ATP-binding protein [Hyphomicrobiaceae bacterium]|nr:ABC transporter ATP-binding protein [Hyphomicrobiaceae bacterium]
MDKVVKRFQGVGSAVTVALEKLSLKIERGSFFTLLGPSGCGKSTLLRCLAGLETPDEGDILIHGKLVFSASSGTAVPTNRRNLGMVFQSYAIWPHMTVYANVAFPLQVRKVPDIRDRTLRALELVGLAGFAERDASKLSGGQQQRVALARAIVAEPDVLLLDEPLSNLDAALRDQMRAELLNIQRTLGITSVYVTHDQGEALSMSDRIALMSQGRLIEVAAPEELYDRPRSVFAARFIGGANILPGDARKGPDGQTIVDTVIGQLVTSHAAAGKVNVFIRPEKVMAADGQPAAANTLACSVHGRRFAGENVELDLMPQNATADVMLRCRMPAQKGGSIGAPIHVSIAPSDVRILA